MFSDYIINIEKENCSPEISLTLLPIGNLYVITLPYGTQILGTYSNVTEVAAVNETVINVTVTVNTEITLRFIDNEESYLIQVFNNTSAELATSIVDLICSTSVTTIPIVTTGITPQYLSYSEIYYTTKYALTIHARMIHRMANNVMFLGNSDEMRNLYSQLSKLWVLSETILELIKDNPLFHCDEVLELNSNYDISIDINIYNKYVFIFNNLYGCLKNTIEHISKKYKKALSIQTIKDLCELQNNYLSGDSGSSSGCLIGDYNDDYNDDYFKEICNDIQDLIVCDNIYTVISMSDKDGISAKLSDVTGFSVGDYVEFGKDSTFVSYESIVCRISYIDVGSNILEFSGYIPSSLKYTSLMKINKVSYNIIGSIVIKELNLSTYTYTVEGDVTGLLKEKSSVVITDTGSIKYYDVVSSVSFDNKTGLTTFTSALNGVNHLNITSFEITDKIASSSYC